MKGTGKLRAGRLKIWERKGFRGGTHLTDGRDKLLTGGGEIVDYEPETVTISLEQYGGNRCRLLVREGDRVRAGQKIGEPETDAGVPVHASIGGIIEKIEISRDDEGKASKSCVIRRVRDGVWREPCAEQPLAGKEGTFEEKERATAEKKSGTENGSGAGKEAEIKKRPLFRKEHQDYRKRLVDLGGISREEILQGLKEGGVVGMGGAGFAAVRKYATDRRVHTVLINGAECEPFLTCDHRLMLEHGMEILNGARLLVRCVSAGKALVCIEENKPDAAAHLKKLLREDFSQVEIVTVPARYPQGGERQLIQTVLGMEVPEGGLPVDLGVIVSNVATAKAAADCVLGGKPLTHRCVTISGLVKEPGNFMVPIGTSIRELLKLCQGVTTEENRVTLGGPMTGVCGARDWDGGREIGTVSKTLSGVTVLGRQAQKASPCIRCGGCVQVCPAGLAPFQIEFAWLKGNREQCEKLHANQCIRCGCCSFVCPAKRELAYHISMARKWKAPEIAGKKQDFRNAEEMGAGEKGGAECSPGPYLRSGNSTGKIMGHVLISLLPALAGSVYFFGLRSLLLTGTAAAVCMLSELLWQAVRREQITVTDLSAAVTGVLLAFHLPACTPVWAVCAASVFAILFAKQFFGGIGNNFANPALMGRLLLMTVWPQTVAVSPLPRTLPADGVSSATVLAAMKSGSASAYSYWQMFVGEIPGALGETSKLLLLIGFLYLCWRGAVNMRAALAYIGTVTLMTFVLGPEGFLTGDLPGNLLGGGLILGGFFMLTDYGFTTRRGRLLFGVAAGILTGLLRVYGRYPEGVCYGILAANCLGGLLSKLYRPRVYGTKRKDAGIKGMIKNGAGAGGV